MTWPYGDPPEYLLKRDELSWACPHHLCECDVGQTGEEVELSIVVLAHTGKRMDGARVRVHHRGLIINDDMKNAGADGRVVVKLNHMPTSLFVEWAPAHMPLEAPYPYRARYFANLGEGDNKVARRRLANLGFWTGRTLEDNVAAFQEHYGHVEITRNVDDIALQLAAFHDTGSPFITKDEEEGRRDLDSQAGGERGRFGHAAFPAGNCSIQWRAISIRRATQTRSWDRT